MRYCENCGKQLDVNVKFCPFCGSAAGGTRRIRTDCAAGGSGDRVSPGTVQRGGAVVLNGTAAGQKNFDYSEKIGKLTASEDRTAEYDREDIDANKAYAVLSYIGFLSFLTILMGSKSRFARFHANQGLVLFIAEFVFGVLRSTVLGLSIFSRMSMMSALNSALGIFNIVFFILSVYGVIHAAKGEARELPLFGSIKLLK